MRLIVFPCPFLTNVGVKIALVKAPPIKRASERARFDPLPPPLLPLPSSEMDKNKLMAIDEKSGEERETDAAARLSSLCFFGANIQSTV